VSSEGSFYSQSLGKYWQLNQSNQHTSTYSRIQQQTKNPYYLTILHEYAQENPRINRQDRQKITFPGSAYPKEISQQCTPATHTEAVHCQGSSIPVSDHWRLLDPVWGRVAKPLVSPLTPVHVDIITDWQQRIRNEQALCDLLTWTTVTYVLSKLKHMPKALQDTRGIFQLRGQLHLVFLHNQVENENINDDVICWRNTHTNKWMCVAAVTNGMC